MENPFFVGGPVSPDRIVGRRSELRTAFDVIFQRGNLAIWGASVGKSSLLRYLTSPEAWQALGHSISEAVIVTVNCTDIHPFTPHGFCRQVLSLVRDQCDDAALQRDIDQLLAKPVVGRDDIRAVIRHIGQRNQFLVLLVDDYDIALRPNEQYTEDDMLAFLFEVRALAVHTAEGRQYCSNIVTTFGRLDEIGPQVDPRDPSPWYNQYQFMALKPFNDREVEELLSKMPPEYALTPELKAGIREISGNHPALLQNGCNLLLSILRDGGRPDANVFSQEFVNATSHYFSNTWALCTEEEQMLLMLIALSGLEGRLNRKRQYDLADLDIIFTQKERVLSELENRGVIRKSPDQGVADYCFDSSIMEWWVIKEIENSRDEAELAQRQKVFLNMSNEQLDRAKNVMLQVWKNRDAGTAIVGWAGQLAGAFAKGFGRI